MVSAKTPPVGLGEQVKHDKGPGFIVPGQSELFQQGFHTSWHGDSAATTK